jgi:capsular exopolysaccharide synthesis family protein
MSASKYNPPPPQVLGPGRSPAAAELNILPWPEYEEMSSSREYIPLTAYWYILSRQRWLIAAVTLTLTVLVAVVSFVMTPVYKATARVEVEPETPQLESSSDPYHKSDADDTFLQTQIQVLQSETLAWQTIQQLDLAQKLGVVLPDKPTKNDIEKHKVELIQAFQDSLKVETIPKTRMLSVGFESADPRLAAQVATGLVQGYLDYNFREKDEAIRRSGWMEKQLAELKDNVEKSHQAVVTYEQQNQIANSGDKQNVLEQMLADQSRDLANAESDRIQKEALYRQATVNRSHLATLVHDDLLEKLEETAADLNQQHTDALAKYGPNFPTAKRLQLEIEGNQRQIQSEQNRVINRMSNDYSAANHREQLASSAVRSQKEAVGKLSQLLIQDNILRHEFDTNQQLYDSLLHRMKDATVSAALRSTNIHLVDNALTPIKRIRPRRLLNIVLAVWAGLILGVIAAFAREAVSSSIKTAEEAEALMGMPALGIIPFEHRPWFKTRALRKKNGGDRLALSLTKNPRSSLSEAFRALGTFVSMPSSSVKTLLITSGHSGEGKTTTALNLAQALAQRKGPVLLMDCDLRKGGVARALGIENNEGVSTILAGERNVSEVLRYCLQKNLWVLTSGPVPSNPVGLLAGPNMANLLKSLSSCFECIIVDSPPVLAVTDAAILSSVVDGVLLVAASGTTPRGGLIRARRVLVTAGARILGMSLNKLDPRRPGYANYSYFPVNG